jgi:putative ABC transport system substrate-binding protein
VRRRDLFAFIGGLVTALPRGAFAEQQSRTRRIGTLLPAVADDPTYQTRLGALLQELQQLGWTLGRNLRVDSRWTAGNPANSRKFAAELVALAPDVIIALGSSTVVPLLETTRKIPIVFTAISDPVGAGIVESLARPGGNATGFMPFEYSMGAKWLELLKEVAPHTSRVAVLRDTSNPAGIGQFGAVQSAAAARGMEVTPLSANAAGEIERTIATFARVPNGGLIATSVAGASLYRRLLVTLAADHKVPAVYFERSFVEIGGLTSYGPNYVDQFRRAAHYADRILNGETPNDLPVQAPTKYELVVNNKAAMRLGLDIPATVLVRADEVIE